MSGYIAMAWESWVEQFSPMKNHHHAHPCGGFMFESHGEDLDFVKAQDPRCVWTLVDNGESDSPTILNGIHFVNRLGYFVTKRPVLEDTEYEVVGSVV